MPARRKFGKNAAPGEVRHFRLVSRSQNDNNEDAAPLVLEPFVKPGDTRRTGLTQAELTSVPAWAGKHADAFADKEAHLRNLNENFDRKEKEDAEEEKDWEAELEGDCYFPKDGYNYDKHLRRVSGTGKGGGAAGTVIEAPVQVDLSELAFQPAQNEEEAALFRALDCADEYEEIEDAGLEDILGGEPADDEEFMLWGPTAAENVNLPDLADFKIMHAERMAMKAKAAEDDDEEADGDEGRQAASSSRTAPPAELAASAAQFEEFFAAEYGDEEDIGELDEEEIEGHAELDDELLDEYIEAQKKEVRELNSLYEPMKGKLDDVPRVIEETKAIVEKWEKQEQMENESTDGEESEDESRTWDCESVLSTLSNISNRPGRIGKIKIIKKPAPAMKPLKEGNESSEDEDEIGPVVELPDVILERKKDETPEEKKARKAGVKDMRRICRQMKKETKQTYKDEAAKLQQGGAGDVRNKARVFRL
mmetsp:Transcript_99153/g.251801  ORF Transcript_99153/g.251801 Transcript_99153/m.251801 type:complete len:479 (-) Transcript_99153:38-1474(-)